MVLHYKEYSLHLNLQWKISAAQSLKLQEILGKKAHNLQTQLAHNVNPEKNNYCPGYKTSTLEKVNVLTLTLLELKVISLCHQYIKPGELAHLCNLTRLYYYSLANFKIFNLGFPTETGHGQMEAIHKIPSTMQQGIINETLPDTEKLVSNGLKSSRRARLRRTEN